MKNKNPNHRPPVGGYGTKSKRVNSTIRLPEFLYKWVITSQKNVAKYIRELILKDYEKENKKG